MKEIGGYFGLEQFPYRPWYHHLLAVNSGRNALLYLLKVRNIQKLYIPFYLCESVSELCRKNHYDIEYYHIDSSFQPIFQKKLGKDEWIYVVNYFGQISNARIAEIKAQHVNVIFDNIQAFFQQPVFGVDTVYSCRKFFGVPDGGYVSTDCENSLVLQTDVSMDRMKHILGRFEGSASEYYAYFRENDIGFKNLPLRGMSRLTQNILGAINYAEVIRKRNDNYAYLSQALGEKNRLTLTAPAGPYCYPFYCENGMQLKKAMAERKVYVPTLWPNVLRYDNTIEKEYAENILPLPCDQRYGTDDMQRIVNVLFECMHQTT